MRMRWTIKKASINFSILISLAFRLSVIFGVSQTKDKNYNPFDFDQNNYTFPITTFNDEMKS